MDRFISDGRPTHKADEMIDVLFKVSREYSKSVSRRIFRF